MTYWEKRQQKAMQAMEKDELKFQKRLYNFYVTEMGRLDRLISSYYAKYGVNNVLSFRTMQQSLSDNDKQLLYDDCQAFAMKYPQYAHLLPVRESIYKLNRLEGLQQSIKLQQLQTGAYTINELTTYLNGVSERALQYACETLGYEYNPEIVKMFVNTPWNDGTDFSTRVWKNTDKLSNYLCTDIAQAIARGDNYRKCSRMLTDRFLNVSKKDAYRLMYTEGTFVYNQATKSVVEKDFMTYKVSHIHDGRTCDVCADMGDKEFLFEDAEVGVNFPPFHPWCRCSFEVVVHDRQQWIDDYTQKHQGMNVKPSTVLKRFIP